MSAVFTVYVVVNTLVREMQDPARWERALGLLRAAHVNQVVLEGYRGGVVQSEAELVEARDRLEAEGFKTLGGFMPVWGEGFGKNSVGAEANLSFFCYTSEDTQAALEAEVRKLARVFQQVVIDDAFMTTCRCTDCDAARAGRDWGVFRRELITNASKRFIKAAREERSDVNFTIKFPQTYDRYQVYGYDTATLPKLFDKVWVGTESRDPDTARFGFTQQYQGYFNAAYMRELSGDKFEGGWYDYIECTPQLFYEQAVTTAATKPDLMILFCWGDPLFASELIKRVAGNVEAIGKIREAATTPGGVHVIKPPNSEGGDDLFIFDVLGMLGIPCAPAVAVTPEMRSIIASAHAFADPATPGALIACIESGGQVILTHAALREAAKTPALAALFGYRPEDAHRARTQIKGVSVNGVEEETPPGIHIAGNLRPDAETTAPLEAIYGAFGGKNTKPLITVRAHASGGRGVVWNLDTFNHDAYNLEERLCVPARVEWLNLPEPAINLLRNEALFPLGIKIEAPARVAVFLFEGHVMYVNYRKEASSVKLAGLDLDESKLFADSPDTGYAHGILEMAPGSFAIVPVHGADS